MLSVVMCILACSISRLSSLHIKLIITQVLLFLRSEFKLHYCKTLFIRDDFIFRVNSQEHRDVKIKSSPIICNVRIIEKDMTSHENKVS